MQTCERTTGPHRAAVAVGRASPDASGAGVDLRALLDDALKQPAARERALDTPQLAMPAADAPQQLPPPAAPALDRAIKDTSLLDGAPPAPPPPGAGPALRVAPTPAPAPGPPDGAAALLAGATGGAPAAGGGGGEGRFGGALLAVPPAPPPAPAAPPPPPPPPPPLPAPSAKGVEVFPDSPDVVLSGASEAATEAARAAEEAAAGLAGSVSASASGALEGLTNAAGGLTEAGSGLVPPPPPSPCAHGRHCEGFLQCPCLRSLSVAPLRAGASDDSCVCRLANGCGLLPVSGQHNLLATGPRPPVARVPALPCSVEHRPSDGSPRSASCSRVALLGHSHNHSCGPPQVQRFNEATGGVVGGLTESVGGAVSGGQAAAASAAAAAIAAASDVTAAVQVRPSPSLA